MYRIEFNPKYHAGDIVGSSKVEIDVWQFTQGEETSVLWVDYKDGAFPWPDMLLDPFNILIIKNTVASNIANMYTVHWQLIPLQGAKTQGYSIANILNSVPCRNDQSGMPVPIQNQIPFDLFVSSKETVGPAVFGSDKLIKYLRSQKLKGVVFSSIMGNG
jgi:hypothetical protein